MQNGKTAIPINPRASTIEGIETAASVEELPDGIDSLSIITPPAITLRVVEQAIDKGISNLWMQPGAENDEAVRLGEEAGLNIIADGSCILVVMGYRDH
jgi:predicted CoA-binding protein